MGPREIYIDFFFPLAYAQQLLTIEINVLLIPVAMASYYKQFKTIHLEPHINPLRVLKMAYPSEKSTFQTFSMVNPMEPNDIPNFKFLAYWEVG